MHGCVRAMYISLYIDCFVTLAALEMLEMDLNTMQQRSELQDAHLLILREQKLAEVTKEA